MNLNPLARGARKSIKALHEYDFDLGSCPIGNAVASHDSLIPAFESFQELLNRVTESYQATNDDNRSFVLHKAQEMTRCRMIDELMEVKFGQEGPTALQKDSSSQDAPTIKWSRVISAIQAGIFCQADESPQAYRGQLGCYEYIITKRQWDILLEKFPHKVPSQSDWREECNERQDVSAVCNHLAKLLNEGLAKLQCLSRAIDEKNAVIQEFEHPKNGLAALPSTRNPSVTTPSDESCHKDSASEPSIFSVDERDSDITTPMSTEDYFQTSTNTHPIKRTEEEKAEGYLFVRDLRSRGVSWENITIPYSKKFKILRTEGALSVEHSKEGQKRERGRLVLKVCPSRLREILLETTSSSFNTRQARLTSGGAISKLSVRRITTPSTEPYDGMKKSPSDACPETLADDAAYVPFQHGLPLIPRVSPVWQSEKSRSLYGPELPS